MVNVLGPTSGRPSRSLLDVEPAEAEPAPSPGGERNRLLRRMSLRRRTAGAVAAAALILAGGVAYVATGAFDGEGEGSALDAGGGTVAVSSADAGLARWAELHGKRYHRAPRPHPRPRPGRTTTTITTAAAVPDPAPASSLASGSTLPPPAGPTTSEGVAPALPATDPPGRPSSTPSSGFTSTSSGRPTSSTRAASSTSTPSTRSTSSVSAATSTRPVAAVPPTAVSPTTPATTRATPPPTTRPSTTTTAPATNPPPASGGGSGQVVWEDNFDRLDTGRWSLEHSTYGDGNKELQCYRPENVSVSGGKLVLRAVSETYTCPNGSTRQVTSGMVRSRGVVFSPGQALEFRVKLTPADESDQGGLWPGVWSSGFGSGGWPAGGEMDYLEVMTATNPKRSVYSIHYAKADGSHGVTNKPVVGAANFSAAWHTVRYEYGLNGRLTWYLDGQQVFSVTSAPTGQGYPAPFDQPVREIKINLALGGNPGPLAPGAVGSKGATFEVDYIRVTTL